MAALLAAGADKNQQGRVRASVCVCVGTRVRALRASRGTVSTRRS